MKKLNLTSFLLVLVMLCMSLSSSAMTIEDFFYTAPGVTIQVTNDSSYPWTVNDNGELVSNMHIDSRSTTITFTNTSSISIGCSFEWNSIGESRYDYIYYSVNENRIADNSGNQGYRAATVTLEPSQTLSFTFRKDGSTTRDPDCGFIKHLVFGAPVTLTDGNWNFIADNRHVAMIKKYNGSDSEIIIPNTLSFNGVDYTVNSIDANVFKDKTTITSVVIPETVKSIGDYAFSGCTNLSSVTMGDDVTLGTDVFAGTATHYVNQDASGTYIDANGSQWGYIINHNSTAAIVTSYSGNDFALILPSVIIMNDHSYPVKAIGNNVFNNNNNLTSVVFPETLETIGSSTFAYCTNLISVSCPDALTTIGNSAFYGCNSLTTILFDNAPQLQTISDFSFSDCAQLSNFALPSTVTTLGNSAFYNCSKLASIKIPNCLKTIGESAFNGCLSLKTVEIADEANLETIGRFAFQGCNALAEFNFPASLVSIGDEAFATNNYSNSYINNVSCRTVEWYQWIDGSYSGGLTNLSSVDFSKCTNLSTIGEYAFLGTKVKCFDLSNCTSLLSIGHGAFSCNYYASEINLSGCTSLSSIQPVAFYRMGADASEDKKITLSGCDALTSIEQMTFYNACMEFVDLSGCTALQTIDTYAFANCWRLTEISIPDAVTTLGTYAFSDDTRLKSINFGAASALRSVGNYAFHGCSDLLSVTLPKTVCNINSYAFDDCTSLEKITLAPDGDLKSIGMYAFNNCYSLSVLTIPNTVTSIAASAFNFGAGNTTLIFVSADPKGYDVHVFDALDLEKVHIKIPASAKEEYETHYPDIAFIYADVERIELNYNELSASVNNDYAFRATVFPENAVCAVQWVSSDENVATIDAEGVMHGVTTGIVTITAKAIDGSGVSEKCTVNVHYVDMQSIQLAQNSYWYRKGTLGQIDITTAPANASDRNVTFVSSNPEIATVDEYGNVKAIAVGKCSISATSATNPDVTATADIDVRAYKPAKWVVDGDFIKDAETGLYLKLTCLSELKNDCVYGYDLYKNYLLCVDGSNMPENLEDGKYYMHDPMGFFCLGFENNQIKEINCYDYGAEQKKGVVEFYKLSDGTYYMSVNGNLVQQTNKDENISVYVENGSNDDWDYTIQNSPYYPENLSARLTHYKSMSNNVVVPETIGFNGEQCPVTGIGNTLTYHDDYGYHNEFGFYNISSVYFPSTIKYIGNYTFANCQQLQTVTFNEGMVDIPYCTFYNCDNLDNVFLPSTIKNIGRQAFYSCDKLSNITLSKDLTSIDGDAFSNCNALASLEVPDDNMTFTSVDGVLYKKDMSDIVIFPHAKGGSFTIPSTMTSIRQGLFSGCTALTEVTIPSSIKTIGSCAFNASM